MAVVATRKRHTEARAPAVREPEEAEPIETESTESTGADAIESEPVHAESAEPEPVEPQAAEAEPVDVPPEPVPRNLRALYDHLVPHLGRWRAEIVDGSLIVSPAGTPEHQRMTYTLPAAFDSLARERGWLVYPVLDVCLPGSRLPYEPDFVMAPKYAPRWGDREVFTNGLIMVGEIVSPGSAEIDRNKKPGIYAAGGVPIMLLVDAENEPATVTVFSDRKDDRYTKESTVEMGEKLYIPEPVDFVLDTGLLLDD